MIPEALERRFNSGELVAAIAQDWQSKEVLMLAWMNHESLELTLKNGFATYWSRSRNTLWKKGESSGNVQRVHSLKYDCDSDAIVMIVEQTGPACHTGAQSCFYSELPLEVK